MKKFLSYEKIIILLNVLLSIAIFILNYFYQYLGFNYTLKCITSSLFAIQGLMNLIYMVKNRKNDLKFSLLMTLGLIFAFLGDVIINKIFVIGALVFALGHVCFVLAYFMKEKLCKLDIFISAGIALFAVVFLSVFPYLVFNPEITRIVCLIYALIISFMLGKAVSSFIKKKDLLYGIIALASFLFFLSDFMLLLAWFSSLDYPWTSNLCMGVYYPALTLLALAILINGYKKEVK